MSDQLFGFQVNRQNDSGEKYLVLSADKELSREIINYQVDMIYNNNIPGLIHFFMKEMDSRKMLLYPVTDLISLEDYLRINRTPPAEFIKILIALLQIIHNSKNYLLSEDAFVIDPGYIFIHPKSAELSILYLPVDLRPRFIREFQIFIVNVVVQTPSLDAGDRNIQRMLNGLRDEELTVSKFIKKLKAIADDTGDDAGHIHYDEGTGNDAYTHHREHYQEMGKKIISAAKETMAGHRGSNSGFIWNNPDKDGENHRGDDGSGQDNRKNLFTKGLLIIAVISVMTALLSLIPGAGDKIIRLMANTDVIYFLAGVLLIGILSIAGLYLKKKTDEKRVQKEEDVFPPEHMPFNLHPDEPVRDKLNTGEQFIAAAIADQRDETVLLNHHNDETTVLSEQVAFLKSVTRDESIIICKYDFVIGRNQELCDYAIKNRNIGRIHARITREGEKYFVTDIDSKNGTFLNGSRLISNQPYEMRENDVVIFAMDEFKFLLS